MVKYAIKTSSYGSVDIILNVDGVYFFSGHLVALNKHAIQCFYYNSDHRSLGTASIIIHIIFLCVPLPTRSKVI